MFPVKFGIYFLSLLVWWIPFAVIFVSILDLGVSVLFGIKGTEWAWNNRSWNSITNFKQTQETWNKAGLAFFLFGVMIMVIVVIYSFAAISQLL